jgi:hypothetical protein
MPKRAPRNLAEQAALGLMLDGVKPLKATWMASQVCVNLWCLARSWRSLGRMPTQLEYCQEWKVNERTAQRHWAEIKRAFPGLTDAAGNPVPDRQAVEYLTAHVLRQMSDADATNEAAALAIDPLDPLPASLADRLAQLHA